MLEARIKKLEKITINYKIDPYAHLSDKELGEELRRVTKEIHKIELTKDKARAKKYKELFIDTQYMFSLSPSFGVSKEKKVDVLKKRMAWELKKISDKEEKQRTIELYEDSIQLVEN